MTQLSNDVIFIFYVENQERTTLFYENVLEAKPILNVPGMSEFKLNEYSKLGLMPESGIVKILQNKVPNPKLGNGIPRAELYLYCKNPEGKMQLALAAGATLISPIQLRNWGDIAGYCADFDGNIIAFAKKV